MRMQKQKTAMTRKVVLMPKSTGTRLVGCAKLGWMPGGGFAAGSVFSAAGGKAKMTFGSIELVDMLLASKLKH